ncbi:LysE family translocator [soil metagenome]
MDWTTWWLFFAANFMLCLTPGPAVLLVISQGLARGGRASLWSTFGILSGNVVYFTLSATGVGALLLGLPSLFFVIKWLGAAYLVWLGLSAWFGHAKGFSIKTAVGPTPPAWRMWLNGLIVQQTNPKALIYFTAILPPFLDPHRPMLRQFLILAATSTACEAAALIGYGFLAGRAARLAAEPRYAQIAERVAGTMLIAAGVLIALIKKG